MFAHRLTTTTVATFAATALALAPAVAGAEEPAPGTGGSSDRAAQDFRSADARDAAARSEGVTLVQDLRSPDARDAADPTQPVVVRVARVDSGFEWDSAAIGALAGAGVLLSLAGGGVLVARRRPRVARPA